MAASIHLHVSLALDVATVSMYSIILYGDKWTSPMQCLTYFGTVNFCNQPKTFLNQNLYSVSLVYLQAYPTLS